MKDNYLVKCEVLCPLEKDEKPKMRSLNLLISAISYTDAEARANKYFEDKLQKEKFSKFSVDKIAIEGFHSAKDFLESADVPDLDDVQAKVFKVKALYSYSGDPMKKQTCTVIARDYDIESVIKQTRAFILEEYSAEVVNVVEIKETVIDAYSPMFDSLV